MTPIIHSQVWLLTSAALKVTITKLRPIALLELKMLFSTSLHFMAIRTISSPRRALKLKRRMMRLSSNFPLSSLKKEPLWPKNQAADQRDLAVSTWWQSKTSKTSNVTNSPPLLVKWIRTVPPQMMTHLVCWNWPVIINTSWAHPWTLTLVCQEKRSTCQSKLALLKMLNWEHNANLSKLPASISTQLLKTLEAKLVISVLTSHPKLSVYKNPVLSHKRLRKRLMALVD